MRGDCKYRAVSVAGELGMGFRDESRNQIRRGRISTGEHSNYFPRASSINPSVCRTASHACSEGLIRQIGSPVLHGKPSVLRACCAQPLSNRLEGNAPTLTWKLRQAVPVERTRQAHRAGGRRSVKCLPILLGEHKREDIEGQDFGCACQLRRRAHRHLRIGPDCLRETEAVHPIPIDPAFRAPQICQKRDGL